MKTFKVGHFFLFIVGIFVLLLVTVQSIRQIANYKTTLALTGFEIKKHAKFYISGYLNSNEVEGFDNEFDKVDSQNKFLFPDSEIPYIGKFHYDESDKVMFIVSGNVYSENRKKENELNVLFPKCYLGQGNSKRNISKLIEPRTRIDENQLLNNKLYFVDRVSGLPVFKLWMENRNGKKIVKTTSFVRTTLNFNDSNKIDRIKFVGAKNYTLHVDDPHTIFVVPSFQSDKTETLRIQKTGFNKYNLLDDEGAIIQKLKRSDNTFYWNGWEFSLLGLPSFKFIFGSIFISLLSCWVFFIWLMLKLRKKMKNPVLQVESRILSLLSVYVIFTSLSVLFVNHIWLSTQYERTYWMLFLSIPIGFFIALTWIHREDRTKFQYTGSDKIRQNKLTLEDIDGKYMKNRLLIFFVFSLLIVVAIAFRTRNERLMLIGDIGDIGLPIIHLSKILVCIIIYVFRDKLFKGDMIAHAFLWGITVTLSVLTGDISSLLFTILCYFVVCKIFLGTVNIPNPLKIKAWTTSFKNTDSSERYYLIKNKFILLAIAVVGIILINQGVVPFFESKIARFNLTYSDLNPDKMLFLSNGHKESFAKIYWTLAEIFQNGLAGTWLNFRAINFYTTWHTDLAFLSFLQYGGLFLLIILSVLVLILLFNYFFSFISLNSIFKKLNDKKQEGPLYSFLQNNVYVLFLLGYILIQTIYPILCNLTLLPLTGQAIPGLSVSIVEYILTPFMLAFIYGTVGGVVHNKLLEEKINNIENKESEKQTNYAAINDNVYKIDRNKFSAVFINGKTQKTFKNLLFFSVITVVLLFVKINYWNRNNVKNESYVFQYLKAEDKNLNKIIQKTNAGFSGNFKDEKEVKNQLIANANEFVLNNSANDSKPIISSMKEYFYSDSYTEKKTVTPFFIYDDSLGITPKSSSERIVKNRIRKNTVVNNMTYANYFNEPKLYFNSDYPLIKNESKIFDSNGKVIINSDFLSDRFTGNKFFSSTKQIPDNKKYDGLDNYFTYKVVNGKSIIVTKYPDIGNVNYMASTYDMDLQTILTVYLENFVRQDKNKKISSIVIAENSSGKIRAMAAYPSYVNKFGDEITDDVKKFRDLKLISHLDVNSLQNYALADAMPGSTFKPIYTFAALANDSNIVNNGQIFNSSLQNYITWSNPDIAKTLFRNQYANEGFGEQMFKCFGIKVYGYKDYGNKEWDNLASNTYILDATQIRNEKITEKANFSSAWGQGNVRMSLTTLVRDFIRINERKTIKLTFTDANRIAENFPISESAIRPLYNGMNGVIFNGTASRIGNELKRLYGQQIENISLYRGKTGTVQFSKEFRNELNRKGINIQEKDNSCAYMIMITPSHTIGVSLFGILPDAQNDSHAKGVMLNMLELLKNWREGMYLQ